MSAGELTDIESKREALLGQLTAAESALRAGLHARGFDQIARAHMERARAHILEAQIAINQAGLARNVTQLVADLNRVKRVVADVQRRKSQRI